MADYISSILNHAINSSSSRSMEKGKQLFNQKNLQLIHLNTTGEEANFSVQGTRLYYVDIYRFMTGSVRTNCSCPYDWGGLCKHEVASLLLLAQELKDQKLGLVVTPKTVEQQFAEKRSAGKPYAIPNYLPFEALELRTHISQLEMRSPVKIENITFVKFENNTLHYELTTWNYMSSFYNREKKFKVSLKSQKSSLLVTCNCNKKVEQLCTHSFTTLTYIKDNADSSFLEILDPEFIERKKKEVAKSADIPYALFDNYFKISIEDTAVQVKSIGEGLGFLSKNTMKSFDLISNIQQVTGNKIANSIPVVIEEGDDDEPYILAFAVNFLSESTYYASETIEIIPFVAKKGKITPLKNYAPYDSYKNIQLTDHQALILHKIDELNELHEFDDDINNFQKLVFHKLKELFPLLHKEKYTFLQHKAGRQNRVTKGNTNAVTFSLSTVDIFLELREEQYFHSLHTCLKIADEVIVLTPENVVELVRPFFIVNHKNKLYLFKNFEQSYLAYQSLFSLPVFKAAKKDFTTFYKELILPLSKSFTINFTDMESIKKEIIPLVPQKRQIFLSELSNFVLLQPMVTYSEGINQNIKDTNAILKKEGNVIYELLRDEAYEQEFQDFIINLHEEFEKQTHSAYHFLTYDDFVKRGWVFDAFDAFRKADIEVFGVNDLKQLKVSPHKATINTHLKSGQDWFDVEINISFGDFVVKLSDVRKAVLKNERYVKLGDGKLGLLPEEWLEKLSKYFRAGEADENGVKISKLKFSLIDELFSEIDNEEVLREIHEKKKRLQAFSEIKDIKLPKKLKATLRDYQKEGYNWLNFLDEFKWGGILADDMGLGKTVQILTFMLKQCEDVKMPNLVVIPTSLLFNWENEIKKFTPSLSVLFHYGPDRKKDETLFEDYNLVITSYGIMVKDVELLKAARFNYIVLDESQAIKNPTSLRYKAACLLNANNRLTMTGTPVENNTFDLYAQINFLNPGFLGNQAFFKAQYSIPIDRDGDVERAGELQRLINPFLLRRTKEIVATELPPKIEDIIYCEMPDAQWKVYEAFRNKYRDLLMKKIDDDGMGKSKMYVLEGLMKLRQICDSPELLSDKEDYGTTSVKVQQLMQHIKEKTGNHKILVFSQFVKMLRVIERELNKSDISYEYLDGQRSKNQRQKSVENFQTDEGCRVFLISLKAGGTGLNLTAADYVYIVDPWWNPAVENQAIDRCHRIGQDKHVIAYRMICKNTVEEKIMKYQAKKLKIAADIITTDESFMKQIGKADIADLFG